MLYSCWACYVVVIYTNRGFVLSWSIGRNCCRLHQAWGQRRCYYGNGRVDKVTSCLWIYLQIHYGSLWQHHSQSQINYDNLTIDHEWDSNNAGPITNTTECTTTGLQTYGSCNLSIGSILLRYKVKTGLSLQNPLFYIPPWLLIIILGLLVGSLGPLIPLPWLMFIDLDGTISTLGGLFLILCCKTTTGSGRIVGIRSIFLTHSWQHIPQCCRQTHRF